MIAARLERTAPARAPRSVGSILTNSAIVLQETDSRMRSRPGDRYPARHRKARQSDSAGKNRQHSRRNAGYGYLPHYNRFTSEYLVAALPLGFQVRHCEELRAGWSDPNQAPPPVRNLPGHPSDIWTLQDWCPAAAQLSRNGDPVLIFWHFQLAAAGLAREPPLRRTGQRRTV